MKKIKFNESISGYGDPTRSGDASFAFVPEQVAEIEDELANAWVESGVAGWAPREAKKAEFAVAKTPEVSKPVEVKAEVKPEPKPEVKEAPKTESK